MVVSAAAAAAATTHCRHTLLLFTQAQLPISLANYFSLATVKMQDKATLRVWFILKKMQSMKEEEQDNRENGKSNWQLCSF